MCGSEEALSESIRTGNVNVLKPVPVDGSGKVRAGDPPLADDNEAGVPVAEHGHGTDRDCADASQLAEALARPMVREDSVELARLLGRQGQQHRVILGTDMRSNLRRAAER